MIEGEHSRDRMEEKLTVGQIMRSRVMDGSSLGWSSLWLLPGLGVGGKTEPEVKILSEKEY